ncbi:RPS6KC1 family protein [Megaselia abdita]
MLVQSVTDKTFYIMKGLEKPSSHSPAQSVFLPQNIPYMVELMAFFQSDEKIFLLLQYANGGNLFDYIQNYIPSDHMDYQHNSIDQIFDDISPNCDDPDNIEDMVLASQKLLLSVSKTLKEVKQIDELGTREKAQIARQPFPVECIKQWARELLIAIESLHMKGVILRDLCRENILMGTNGELLLSYFYQNEGIHSVLPDRVSQKAVENMFVAPDFPLTMKSDWWSYGVILYELLTGYAFSTIHSASVFSYNDVLYPEEVDVPEDGTDLLRKLIEKNVVERFDVKQIKNHKFFQYTDWEDVRKSVAYLD